jgi:benzoate membrane transport protein
MREALRAQGSGQALAAGVSASLLGYGSSIAVVVAGLTAVGADTRQTSSALLVLGTVLAVVTIVASARLRMPISIVWSTSGMALLAGLGTIRGGFAGAVAGLILCGLLIGLTGLLPPLGAALARIPAPLNAAVLAGILLPFCLVPIQGVKELPVAAGAIVTAWLIAARWVPRWAAPAALLMLVVVVALGGSSTLADAGGLAPRLVLVRPVWSWEAVTAVAIPLYIVTMAGQNLVGLAVLRTYGYAPPAGPLLVGTGFASALSAPFGAPTTNLAAITGALTAGPVAHPDPAMRWIAAVAAGATMFVLASVAPLAASVMTQADPLLIGTAAGLALLGAFAGAIGDALRNEALRVPAAATVLVTASGVTAFGVGSAPLGLLAGGIVLGVTRFGRRA